MLFLDGVYVEQSQLSAFPAGSRRRPAQAHPADATIAHRVGRYLERQGLLEQDVENSYLASRMRWMTTR